MERIYHPWNKWECYRAGFFKTSPPDGMTKEEASNRYASFFTNLELFESCIEYVFINWPNSCEHNLTNDTMNKVAWLGQACVCAHYGISSNFRQAYNLLPKPQQERANKLAQKYIDEWEFNHKQIKMDI